MRCLPATAADLPWIAERAGLVIGPTMRAIKAVDPAGRIHGVVAYDGWTGSACSIHVALDNPAALRVLLRPGFGIPFEELDRAVVLAMVLSTNARSLNLVRRLGFRQTHVTKDGWQRGVDLVWFEMRREDCRWLQKAKEAA